MYFINKLEATPTSRQERRQREEKKRKYCVLQTQKREKYMSNENRFGCYASAGAIEEIHVFKHRAHGSWWPPSIQSDEIDVS